MNKLVSLVAGRQSPPRELVCVRPGLERSFLAPLKVQMLPAVDRKLYTRLRELNFQIVQQVADMGPMPLEAVFGRTGLVLHRQALGVDSSPVRPPSAIPHLTKRAELGEDTNDLQILKHELFSLVEEAMSDLRRSNRAARKLQLDLLYSDFKTARGARTLRDVSNQLSLWYCEAEDLFLRILTRRIRVRAIELRFEDFKRDMRGQMGLFDGAKPNREDNLARSLDGIRAKFGGEAVRFGVTN